jgi:hypothetical protein
VIGAGCTAVVVVVFKGDGMRERLFSAAFASCSAFSIE